jgi:Uma2 family endonuclease
MAHPVTLTQPPQTLTQPPQTPELNLLRRWTVTEYHRLYESGILAPDERTELLAGEIALMSPKGTPHVLSLRLLSGVLDALLAQEPVFVSTQDPIHLNEFSEPEPDLAIVQGTALDYANQHPQPNQIDLVVEVADFTLKQDWGVKDKLYAQAGIRDYWVLDVQNRQIHIFRNPTATGYTSHLILSEPHQIAPLAFGDCTIDLTSILPPQAQS